MNSIGTKEIYTKNLLLRKFNNNDAKPMYMNYCNDEEVTKFLSWNPHKDIYETTELLKTKFSIYNDKIFRWAITLKNNQNIGPIGSIDFLSIDFNKAEAEVGYVLSKKYWNKGIMSEAFSAVIDYFFNEMNGIKLNACFIDGNSASEKVMIKCGLKRANITKEIYLPLKNKKVKVIYYFIDKLNYINKNY